MKKVLSFTLATLASATLFLPVTEVANAHSGKKGGFSMEAAFTMNEPMDQDLDFATSQTALGNVAVTTYFNETSAKPGGYLRFGYTDGAATYFLSFRGFDNNYRDSFTALAAQPISGVPTLNMNFQIGAANNQILSTATNPPEKINTLANFKELDVKLGVNYLIKLSDDSPFKADWEAGVIYLEDSRDITHDFTIATTVGNTLAGRHLDITQEQLDGFGVFTGLSTHVNPSTFITFLTFFAHGSVAMVYGDHDFYYHHQLQAGNPPAGDFSDTGDIIRTKSKSTVVRLGGDIGAQWRKPVSRTLDFAVSVGVEFYNTINALRGSDRYFSDNTNRRAQNTDFSHYALFMSFFIGDHNAKSR